MIEKITYRDGEKVIHVRSQGGSLLYIKTKEGYEIKCRKTKEICVIRYEQMFVDCLRRFFTTPDDEELLTKAKQIRHALDSLPSQEKHL